jgi:D-inositol-3-phosphate glycosyltransferase
MRCRSTAPSLLIVLSNSHVRRVALLSLHSSPLASMGNVDTGGMNLYVLKLARGLAAAGLEVDVFTRRNSVHTPPVAELTPGANLISIAGGRSRQLPKSVLPLHLPEMVEGIRRYARAERREYDVWHSHYWLSGMAARELRASSRSPLVHMFHTLAKVKELYSGQPDPNDTILRFDGERTVMEDADVIVGATVDEQHLMRRLYPRPPRDYAVIPPGVDTDVFRPIDRAASRRVLGIDAEKVILFVGRPDRIKGFNILLRAVGELKASGYDRLKLIVVGGFGAAGEAGHKRLEREYGLEKTVEWRGVVAQEGLASYYSAADLCAIPSAYESFGMVALEAMACQTPVVAFAVGGLAATVNDGKTGFLARAGDPADFARLLADALSSPTLDVIGRRARIAVQRYTWESVTSRTLEVYQDAICSAGRVNHRVCQGG